MLEIFSLLNSSAARIVITLFTGYPLGLFYRSKLCCKSERQRHMYFFITGFVLMLLNFGLDAIHGLIAVTFSYLLCRFMAGSRLSVFLAFTCLMSHYLLGLYFDSQFVDVEGKYYEMNWTTPQCVLVLRLIALVFDVYDGHRPQDQLKQDQKEHAIKKLPSFLEICAYCYFYGGFLVGPQFPLSRFRKLTHQTNSEKPKTYHQLFQSTEFEASFHAALIGTICVLLYALFYPAFPDDFFASSQFLASPVTKRYVYMVVWVYIVILRYFGVWSLADGACILTGLSGNGTDELGVAKYDGTKNCDVFIFLSAKSFRGQIEGWQRQTNLLLKRIIFKRLAFLGNRNLSHLLTMLFAAIWHGLYVGYFATFVFQFLCVAMETQISQAMQRMGQLNKVLFEGGKLFSAIIDVIQGLLVATIFSYGILPMLLVPREFMQVYHLLYYGPWIICTFMLLITSRLFTNSITRLIGEKPAGRDKIKTK